VKETIFVVSDLHLDAVTLGVPRLNEVRAALSFVVDQVNATPNAWLVFNGDAFDPDKLAAHRCSAKLIEYYRALKRPEQSLWVAGNHDVVDDGEGTTTLSSLEAAGAPVFSAPDCDKYFTNNSAMILPYPGRGAWSYDPAEEVRKFAPYKPVLVFGHLSDKGCQPGSESEDMASGRDVDWPHDELEVRMPQAVRIGGHYHRGGRYGNLHVVGAPARFNFGEQASIPSYLRIEIAGTKVEVFREYYPNPRGLYSLRGQSGVQKVPSEFRKGDIVRVLFESDEEHDRAYELTKLLDDAGAAATKLTRLVAGDRAPIEIDVPLSSTDSAKDGFEVAAQLAREWPNADAEFREALSGLVDELKGKHS
jgi:DNA repair exonuclease SbcCD nuclease subunit